MQIVKTPEQKENFSELWHVDSSYLETPPDLTMLASEVIPLTGGDTVFSNTTLAFESLSEGMKSFLRKSNALFSSHTHKSNRIHHLTNPADEVTQAEVFSTTHPAIYFHKETNKESIYINKEHTKKIAGFTEEESQPIMNFIFSHIAKPEFTYKVKWEPNMIALWDNRAVQHYAVNNYCGQLRIMNRITIHRVTA
ncbi:hypothetical protein GCM10027514_02000 [Azotobacter armeniacus]